MTDEQLDKAVRWVARGITEAEVNPQDVGAVVRWVLRNPLPDLSVMEEEVEEQDRADKLEYIQRLEDEAKRLREEL